MIIPIKAQYVTTKNHTNISYIEEVRGQRKEKILTIKGRLPCEPTVYNVEQLIKKEVQ